MNTPSHLHIIGLTGPIASGKSTVLSALRALPGITVGEADAFGHAAYAPGSPLSLQISRRFPGTLRPDGSVDRTELGKRVFGNANELRALNELVWPEIRTRVLEDVRGCVTGIYVLEAAVLIEAGWGDVVDEIWTVRVEEEEDTMKRLMGRNEMNRKDAEARLRTQKPRNEERLQRAHLVLENNGTLEDLVKQTRRVYDDLTKRLCTMFSNGSEKIDIVTVKDNQVVEVRKRAVMRAFNLPHRSSYVIVKHVPSGKFIVEQRSHLKEYMPSRFDPTPGGVVDAGESYEENAKREMQEELGLVLQNSDLKFVGDLFFHSPHTRCWCRIFYCEVNNAFPHGFALQKEEVESIHLMTEQDILVNYRQHMAPDAVACFEVFALTLSRM